MQPSKSTHFLFLWLSIIFLICSFFLKLNQTLDLHFQDTIYVISLPHIFKIIAVLFSIMWLIYTFSYKILFSKKLYHVHVIGSILFVFVWGGLVYYNTLTFRNVDPKTYLHKENWSTLETIKQLNDIVTACGLILIALQLIYPLNLMIGLIKNKKS